MKLGIVRAGAGAVRGAYVVLLAQLLGEGRAHDGAALMGRSVEVAGTGLAPGGVNDYGSCQYAISSAVFGSGEDSDANASVETRTLVDLDHLGGCWVSTGGRGG